MNYYKYEETLSEPDWKFLVWIQYENIEAKFQAYCPLRFEIQRKIQISAVLVWNLYARTRKKPTGASSSNPGVILRGLPGFRFGSPPSTGSPTHSALAPSKQPPSPPPTSVPRSAFKRLLGGLPRPRFESAGRFAHTVLGKGSSLRGRPRPLPVAEVSVEAFASANVDSEVDSSKPPTPLSVISTGVLTLLLRLFSVDARKREHSACFSVHTASQCVVQCVKSVFTSMRADSLLQTPQDKQFWY